DLSHPALKQSLVNGYNFVNEAASPSELNDLSPAMAAALTQSTTSILDGQNLVQLNASTVAILSQSTTSILDGPPSAFGHGTMTAGIVHLVAPQAKIMPLKSFNANGTGYDSDILRAIYYAVKNGAKVLNMSFDYPSYSSELANAIKYANSRGVVSVASAGNGGQQVAVYPGALPSVIDVASTSNSDIQSTFTN